MRVVIPVSMDTETDRDILDWLNQSDNRSSVVRDALRAYHNQSVTLTDVYHAILDLKLAGTVVSDNRPATSPDEPDDIADTLNQLGL